MCGSGAWTDGGRQRQSCNPGLPYNSMDGRLKIDGAKATTDRGAGLTAIHSALAIVVQAGDARPPRDMKTKIRPSGKMVESAHSPFDAGIGKGKEMERERGGEQGTEGREGGGEAHVKGTQNGSHAKPATAEGCEKKQSDKGLRGHIGDCFAYIVSHASGRGAASPRPNGRSTQSPFPCQSKAEWVSGWLATCVTPPSRYLNLGGVARNIPS